MLSYILLQDAWFLSDFDFWSRAQIEFMLHPAKIYSEISPDLYCRSRIDSQRQLQIFLCPPTSRKNMKWYIATHIGFDDPKVLKKVLKKIDSLKKVLKKVNSLKKVLKKSTQNKKYSKKCS